VLVYSEHRVFSLSDFVDGFFSSREIAVRSKEADLPRAKSAAV